MTCDPPTPPSASPGVPATKFGIAIGSGVNSPSGTMMRFGPWASAVRPPATAPIAAMPEMIWRRLRRNGIWGNPFWSVITSSLVCICGRRGRMSGLLFGENRREIFPFLEKRRRQFVGLAFDDRPQRALLIDAQIRRRWRAFRHRHPFQRTVALEA